MSDTTNQAQAALGFNSQPPEGGWASPRINSKSAAPFQLTAARRRLASARFQALANEVFQLTAARRRLASPCSSRSRRSRVSTHSRPKAAGIINTIFTANNMGFNSQPPEGGWWPSCVSTGTTKPFQLTAARRRLVTNKQITIILSCFNSQPPEGGWVWDNDIKDFVSTFQLTAARRRLARPNPASPINTWFQLTAARRRLEARPFFGKRGYPVSTHSRPKAAGQIHQSSYDARRSFNSQPPEGGWLAAMSYH